MTILAKTHRLTPCVAALVFLLVGVGCDIDTTSLPLERSEVIGQYRANYLGDTVEEVTLRDDSTYEHTMQAPGDSNHIQEGTWEFRPRKNGDGPRVLLRDFVTWYAVDLDCYGDSPKAQLDPTPRNWLPYIKKLVGGVIQIERCPNRHQYYILTPENNSQ